MIKLWMKHWDISVSTNKLINKNQNLPLDYFLQADDGGPWFTHHIIAPVFEFIDCV